LHEKAKYQITYCLAEQVGLSIWGFKELLGMEEVFKFFAKINSMHGFVVRKYSSSE